ncbi:hypothetical protein VFMJ11_A0720 [Aliivibrio fischeri MJ11]|uniref:SMODS and SLOG-associating 2TM effector domain-containing protein n=1 Tax=Aliivibrio fischeri (strain MJ11) TaxID=388396 RepID=B5EUA1_ALIFM|nr:hypothetical protein [Aliivibrio fischeri]ACH64093.1 hypothetical protein VFMJ11_A0720 [Aliivibrio fischeri MJ11]
MDTSKKSLLDKQKLNKDRTSYNSISAISESLISTSPTIDKLSTWVAVGSAAVVSLVITNVDKMAKFYSNEHIKILMICLAISLLFALLQKYFAMKCSLSLIVVDEMKNRLSPILEKYQEETSNIQKELTDSGLKIENDFSVTKALEDFQKMLPWYAGISLSRSLKRNKKNVKISHVNRVVNHFWQSFFMSAQFLLLIIFVFMSAFLI